MDDINQILVAASGECGFDISTIAEPQFLAVIIQNADGPIAVNLFFWLINQEGSATALNGAARLLEFTRDPAVLAEIVDILSGGWVLSDNLVRDFWTVFVRRVEDLQSSYGVRAQALHGALLLSQRHPALLRRLQGVLLDFDERDDPQFLRHAAKVIGAVLAHDPADVFRDKLKALAEIDGAEDEVAMELGLDALRRGLNTNIHEEAVCAFNDALNWFKRSFAGSEERIDAELYRQCTAILVCVQHQGFDGRLKDYIAELNATVFRYAAYLLSADRDKGGLSWIGAAVTEHWHWTMLSLRLGALDTSLEKKIWINVGKVVEDELLAIYRISKSVFLRDRDGGLDAVLLPKISAAFIRHRRHLDELDQWIDESTNSSFFHDATAMRNAIAEEQKRSVLHLPHEVNDDRAVAAILDAGQVSVEGRATLAKRRQKMEWMLELDENPMFARIEDKILQEIEASNKHYREFPDAKVFFTAVLHYSLSFLFFRHNIGRSSDPTAEYLFFRIPKSIPLECELQQDYHRFLMGTKLRDMVRMEVCNVGSGRADIQFAHKGSTMVAEVKRSFNDYDHGQLLDAYGAQTVAYQSTSFTFAFLLVLDLFERDGGQPQIEEQISLKRKKPNGQNTEYDVVVMRVQGQRLTPSKQK